MPHEYQYLRDHEIRVSVRPVPVPAVLQEGTLWVDANDDGELHSAERRMVLTQQIVEHQPATGRILTFEVNGHYAAFVAVGKFYSAVGGTCTLEVTLDQPGNQQVYQQAAKFAAGEAGYIRITIRLV